MSFAPIKKMNPRFWILVFGILFVSLFAISNQSFWIDEADTALKAQQNTLRSWWNEMRGTGGSDMQMPLYMFWIWICGKLFDSSEITLRAVNLFWFVPPLCALWRSLQARPQLQLAAFFVAILSPFAWYYLNEARPYAMQIGSSLFLAASIVHWNENDLQKGEWFWALGFAFALIALAGSSLLGMVWTAAAIAALFFLPSKRLLKLWRHFIILWLFTLMMLVTLGFYYLWTIHAGVKTSLANTTSLKTICFTAYELFGVAGLGPGRLELRAGELDSFKSYALQLILFAVLICILFFSGIAQAFKKNFNKKLLLLVLIILFPVFLIFAAGFVAHFRVLGRHLAPIFPIVVFLLALGVVAFWQRRSGKIFVIIFFGFCLASDFSLRFALRHAKDDYRRAAHMAKNALAEHEIVWWGADVNAAKYYHLTVFTNLVVPGAAMLVYNTPANDLATSGVPAIVFFSRPDIYDSPGTLTAFLERKNFQKSLAFPAFTVWTNSQTATNN